MGEKNPSSTVCQHHGGGFHCLLLKCGIDELEEPSIPLTLLRASSRLGKSKTCRNQAWKASRKRHSLHSEVSIFYIEWK